MKTTTIRGTYGSGKTPCNVITANDHRGGTWYAVEGSCNVNYTLEELTDGVDVEEVSDLDSFTWPRGVSSEESLVGAIEA